MDIDKIVSRAVFVAILCFLLFGGMSCYPEKDNIEIVPTPQVKQADPTPDVPPAAVPSELEELSLGGADNILMGSDGVTAPFVTLRNINSASSFVDSGLLTVDPSGDIKPIKKKGGKYKEFKAVLRTRRIDKGNSRIKAAFKMRDNSQGINEWVLIDKNDKPHKLPKEPKVNSRRRNAPYFQEQGNDIFYLNENDDMIVLDMSDDASQDTHNLIRSGVKQFVMDLYGNAMLELLSGQVVYREAGGQRENRMNGVNESYNDNAEFIPFFLPNGTDLMYWNGLEGGKYGVFHRVAYDQAGNVVVTPAGIHAYNDWMQNGGYPPDFNFYPYNSIDDCILQPVGSKELLLCGTYVYDMGDASNDMQAADISWAGTGAGIAIGNSQNFYYYSHWDTYLAKGSRLTLIDLDAQTCAHIFSQPTNTCDSIASNQEYVVHEVTIQEAYAGGGYFDPLIVGEDNTVRFCGYRMDEEQLLLVEIVGADTLTPEFRETAIETCTRLIKL